MKYQQVIGPDAPVQGELVHVSSKLGGLVWLRNSRGRYIACNDGLFVIIEDFDVIKDLAVVMSCSEGNIGGLYVYYYNIEKVV